MSAEDQDLGMPETESGAAFRAVSRVAYGLALIVDPKCVPVWIVTHQRKRFGGAFFPQHRQCNPIISCVRRACGVHGTVFRKSYDSSTVIDRARLPVISAERRESAHLEELPKKRATRKVCAEAANVFAVRVWDSRLGITHYLPEIVDLAPVAGELLFLQRFLRILRPVTIL